MASDAPVVVNRRAVNVSSFKNIPCITTQVNLMQIWKEKDTVSVSESKFLKYKRIIY
jgi:hypothetical protein